MFTRALSKFSPWAAAAAATLLSTSASAFPAALQTEAPSTLINEVLFDQLGTDADAKFGCEWIELYAVKAIDLSSLQLEDQDGKQLGSLPQIVIAPGTYIHVILGGLNTYEVDDDPTDGTYSLTLGMPLGDILPNAQVPGEFGGVRLLEHGVEIDSIYWGNGAGAAGGQGPYFDISFEDGRPMNEGDSLGRSGSPEQDYTGSIADWERNGGQNAAGATPNQRNGVYVLDSEGALKWIQSGFTGTMNSFAFMTGQPNKYRFIDSNVSNINASQSGDTLTVTADHVFYLVADAAATQMNGTLTATFIKNETPGEVAYYLAASGTVTSAQGWSFQLDYARLVTGLHTNIITAQTQTDVTFHENGQNYPYSCSVTKLMGRTAENAWMMGDQRQGVDYGGAGPKNSLAVTTFTRQSDGQIASHFDMTRDMPIGPPMPGTQDSIQHSQRIVSDVVTTGNDLGEFNAVVSRYDVFEDNQRVIELRPGQTGSSTLGVLGASTQEPLGSANHMLRLPVTTAGRDIDITAGTRGELVVRGSSYIALASSQVNTNGLMRNAFVTLADPPLQQGGGGSSNAGEGGFGDAAVNCATKGGAIGAGAGAVTGGVAGAIGGAAVGGAIGSLGGPPGAIAAGTAGGVKGASVGVVIGSGAGAIVGGGVGAAVCMVGYFGDEIAAGASAAWDWVSSWF